MAKGYWEMETPVVQQFGKTQFRYFKNAGKLQVFPVVETAPNGVGKGATIDLAAMNDEAKAELFQFFKSIL
jgi:hypothetical protein